MGQVLASRPAKTGKLSLIPRAHRVLQKFVLTPLCALWHTGPHTCYTNTHCLIL